MNPITIYQVDKSDLEGFFHEVSSRAFEKFENVYVTSSVASEIWGVTTQTVNNYVKKGIVRPINPGSSKHKFRLSDILKSNPKYKQI